MGAELAAGERQEKRLRTARLPLPRTGQRAFGAQGLGCISLHGKRGKVPREQKGMILAEKAKGLLKHCC